MEMGAEVNGQLVYVEDGEALPRGLEHDGGTLEMVKIWKIGIHNRRARASN